MIFRTFFSYSAIVNHPFMPLRFECQRKRCGSDAFSSSSSGTAKRVRSSNASNEPDSSTSHMDYLDRQKQKKAEPYAANVFQMAAAEKGISPCISETEKPSLILWKNALFAGHRRAVSISVTKRSFHIRICLRELICALEKRLLQPPQSIRCLFYSQKTEMASALSGAEKPV